MYSLKNLEDYDQIINIFYLWVVELQLISTFFSFSLSVHYHFSTMNMSFLKMKNYKTPKILKVKFKKIDKILKLNL